MIEEAIIVSLVIVSSNIMSLGGLALAIGVLVDAAIVMVENGYRHISERPATDPLPLGGVDTADAELMQQGAEPANSVGRVAPSASEPERRRILIDAAKQVGPALLFSLVIIVVSFLPVFLLEAQEGRVFKPLAWTKTIVVFDEEEITEEILQNRVKDTTCRIDELEKHYKKASQLAGRLPTIPAKEKAREYSRCRCGLGREIVRISLIVRNLGFTNFERKRPINRINTTMDTMCSLDRQVSNLEKKIENTRS